MSGILVLKVLVSLLPVIVFLSGLIYLDSFKLVKVTAVLRAIGAGGVAALVAMVINGWLLSELLRDRMTLTLYVAPVVEEVLKASFLVYLLRSHRIGFLVDAAIFGFGIGTGFSLVEILSPCPTNWKMSPLDACRWVDDVMTKAFPLGLIKETTKC